MFDGLNKSDEDHLDKLDKAVRSGALSRINTTSASAVIYNQHELRKRLLPVLYTTVIPQVWRMEELRRPLVMYDVILCLIVRVKSNGILALKIAITGLTLHW